ncbi:MAG: anaerobic ribonucleoside-triphosphate reductase activating protein [Alphaproteobacteria bacterium]|nr:anaerobic ribonucleoside-triphosphate reductase activating protein [Alphaproteobacteria bacterium]
MLTLPIYALTPFTLLDFPDKAACIVWFSGCNMRCGYCHNPEIVRGGKGKYAAEDALSFLEKRRGLLDGVVLSGGEATLYKGIIRFTEAVKSLGYAVKLDTNGTRPDTIRILLEKKLLDYIALDYKAPKSAYRKVTRTDLFTPFTETLRLLLRQGDVPFEVRTTAHSALLDAEDINAVTADLARKGYRGVYYVQNYVNNGNARVLGNLAPQAQPIDTGTLSLPADFTLAFRNF